MGAKVAPDPAADGPAPVKVVVNMVRDAIDDKAPALGDGEVKGDLARAIASQIELIAAGGGSVSLRESRNSCMARRGKLWPFVAPICVAIRPRAAPGRPPLQFPPHAHTPCCPWQVGVAKLIAHSVASRAKSIAADESVSSWGHAAKYGPL
jgi:hypothetical protein